MAKKKRSVVKEKPEYDSVIADVFHARYAAGATSVMFDRDDLETAAERLGLPRSKNLGDLPYTYRYRKSLPRSVLATAPVGLTWLIRGSGRGKYEFALGTEVQFVPNSHLAKIKVLDATPGLITRYALSDEQALLARLRYNRLLDIFTGVTCYSLQNHYRTHIKNKGQAETDEIYVGVGKRGAHFVFPVQAKGKRDKLGVVQIEQDLAICKQVFPNLIARPVAAQFMADGAIALFEFTEDSGEVRIAVERHYQLVPSDQLTPEEIARYAATSE